MFSGYRETAVVYGNLKHHRYFWGAVCTLGARTQTKTIIKFEGVKQMKQLMGSKYGVTILALVVLMLLAACSPTGDVSGQPSGNDNIPGAANDNNANEDRGTSNDLNDNTANANDDNANGDDDLNANDDDNRNASSRNDNLNANDDNANSNDDNTNDDTDTT